MVCAANDLHRHRLSWFLSLYPGEEKSDYARGVPHAELDVTLMPEPGAFVKRFPFDKKSPDGMVRLKIFIGPHPMER